MPDDLDVSEPLAGAELVARWGFVYDEPEERGGGYVAGEFLLRSDGMLLRRYGSSYTNKDGHRWQFSGWKVVSWWEGTADPELAIRELKRQGYDLNQPSPVPIDQGAAGSFLGVPDLVVHPGTTWV
jgi:hypothetical protein